MLKIHYFGAARTSPFVVYEDAFALGDAPLYVGAGKAGREKFPFRNDLHSAVFAGKTIHRSVFPAATKSEALEAERKRISELRARKCPLINKTEGGEFGGRPCKKEKQTLTPRQTFARERFGKPAA